MCCQYVFQFCDIYCDRHFICFNIFTIDIQCWLLTIYRFKWTLINMCVQNIVLSHCENAICKNCDIILHMLKLLSTELGHFKMQVCLQWVIVYIGIMRLPFPNCMDWYITHIRLFLILLLDALYYYHWYSDWVTCSPALKWKYRNRIHIIQCSISRLLCYIWLWTFYDTNRSNINHAVKCTLCYQV